MEPETGAVTLFDVLGRPYRVPSALAEAHRLSGDDVRSILERARTVRLDQLAVPPELRREWEASNAAADADVEGQDEWLTTLIMTKVTILGLRLLFLAWRHAQQQATAVAQREALEREYGFVEQPVALPASGPFRSHDPDTAACAGCQTQVARHLAFFSEQGNVVCRSCHNRQRLVANVGGL